MWLRQKMAKFDLVLKKHWFENIKGLQSGLRAIEKVQNDATNYDKKVPTDFLDVKRIFNGI